MPSPANQPVDPFETRPAQNSSVPDEVMAFINSRINFERIPSERYDLQDFKLTRMEETPAASWRSTTGHPCHPHRRDQGQRLDGGSNRHTSCSDRSSYRIVHLAASPIDRRADDGQRSTADRRGPAQRHGSGATSCRADGRPRTRHATHFLRVHYRPRLDALP